jgi:hypothetical protein
MFRQIIAALIALSGLSTAAAAQSNTPPGTAPAASCALPAVAASAEMNPVPGSNLVTVPVAINGKPKNFLLAVSANPMKVSQAVVDEMKLAVGGRLAQTFNTGEISQGDSQSRNFTVGNTIQATMVDARNSPDGEGRPRVTIPAFTIGGATGKNLLFTIANETEVPKSAPYDGIMSGGIFKQYDVELDFAAMKINYLTPTTCADPHQVVFWAHKDVAVIPMSMVGGKIEVQVDIGGSKINAILDTGSAQTIMRRDVAENTLNLKAGSAQMPPAGDMEDGNGMQIYNVKFPQITFAGGVTAFNVPALVQTNGMTHNLHKEPVLGSRSQFKADPRIPPLTLGMDVLRQLHIYAVYGQNSLYLTSAE